MTIKEVQDLTMEDISKMSKEELYQVTKETSKLVKGRVTRLVKYFTDNNMPLPTAFREWNVTIETESKLRRYKLIDKNQRTRKTRISKKTGLAEESVGDISYVTLNYNISKNSDINEMRYKFKKMKDFLSSKQGTVEGIKTTLKDFYKRIRNQNISSKKKLTDEEYKKLWGVYNQISKQEDFYAGRGYSSEQLQSAIYDMYANKNMDWDDIEEILSSKEMQQRAYVERQEEEYDEEILNIFQNGDND